MSGWQTVLELDETRAVTAGSPEGLAEALGRGADLRVCTEFRHNEHIDVDSDSPELIREAMDFRITYLLEGRWSVGILNLRQPVSLPDRFGPRSSMSFFLYNQDGGQAVARPYLDGVPAAGEPRSSAPDAPARMPKYHAVDAWDAATNAPSSNFVYDFDVYRFMARDDWQEVLSHAEDGGVRSGSVETLADALSRGCEVKAGVSGLADDLSGDDSPMPHQVFVHAGSCYYYTEQKLFITGSQPVVRVRAGIPLRYATRGWDFGWLLLRSDGHVVYRRCDPYNLEFTDHALRCAIRWFVR